MGGMKAAKREKLIKQKAEVLHTKSKLSVPKQRLLLSKGIDITNRRMHIMSQALLAPGAELRALEELDYFKLSVANNILEKKRKEEAERIKFKRLKKHYDQLLNMRKIQLGVSSKNKKNVKMRLVYDFGIADREFGGHDQKNGLADLQLYDVFDQEDHDRIVIDSTMRKFRKGFQYLFKKYANMGY